MAETEQLSPWWGRAVVIYFRFRLRCPHPAHLQGLPERASSGGRVVDPAGTVVFTGDDVRRGQDVFLKHGLMDNGTIWGHGGYLGPDFGAAGPARLGGRPWPAHGTDAVFEELHGSRRRRARGRGRRSRRTAQSQPLQRRDGHAHTGCRRGAETFNGEIAVWKRYFEIPADNGGLPVRAVSDPQELHDLTAFFTWAAWSSVAERPGTDHSYTNNFPYDPPGRAIIRLVRRCYGARLASLRCWAARPSSCWPSGKFDYLGWHGMPSRPRERWSLSAAQTATLKFMAVAVLLFLGQTLIGAAGRPHYRAEPGSFYGIDLSSVFRAICCAPGICRRRSSGLQRPMSAVRFSSPSFWAATSPRGQSLGIHVLFVAIIVVAVGSLLGEWGKPDGFAAEDLVLARRSRMGISGDRPFLAILLAIGLLFWFFLVWRAV